jgi:hypothetical protein
MNRHAHFGKPVTPHRAEAVRAQAAFSSKESAALIAQQRRRLATNAGPSGNPQAQTAAPMLAIAGQDAFVTYAGLNKSTTAPQERSRPSSLSVTSKGDYAPPVGPPVVRLPPAPQIVDNANVQSQQKSQHSADGLAGSCWAASGAGDVGIPLARAKPPPPVLKSNTHATKGGTAWKQEQVKVSKDSCGPIRGIARLLKNDSPSGTYFTIELDVNGKTILSQEILDVDIFSCEGTVITYRPQRYGDRSTALPSNTWQVHFL